MRPRTLMPRSVPSSACTTADASRTIASGGDPVAELDARVIDRLDRSSVGDVRSRQALQALEPAVGLVLRKLVAQGLLSDFGDVQAGGSRSLRQLVRQIDVYTPVPASSRGGSNRNDSFQDACHAAVSNESAARRKVPMVSRDHAGRWRGAEPTRAGSRRVVTAAARVWATAALSTWRSSPLIRGGAPARGGGPETPGCLEIGRIEIIQGLRSPEHRKSRRETPPVAIANIAHLVMQDVSANEMTDKTSAAQDDRAALAAARLRQNATGSMSFGRGSTSFDRRLPSFALEHAVSGDLGHLHAAHDLRTLPTPSRRRLTKPMVVRFRRILRQGLYPLPEAQSVWNGANARVVTILLRQLAAQARAIESLEQQVSELHDELHR